MKTVPGSQGAGKQRLAEKSLSQQLPTEQLSQPTQLGLTPGNQRCPKLRARATLNKVPTSKWPLWRDWAAQL